MKKLVLFMLALISFQFATAQDKEKENNSFKRFYLNAGMQFTSFDFIEKNKSFYIGGEYKLTDNESIALNLNYYDRGYNVTNQYNVGNPKSIGFQIQFNHDWSKLIGLNNDKFDVYTGVGLGIEYTKSKDFTYPDGAVIKGRSTGEFNFGGQIGLRYFITKNIGISTELNMNVNESHLKTGVTYRF